MALVREVSASIVRCELTHLRRESIDLARARAQHSAYVQVLRNLGCHVIHVDPVPGLPDAVFVEDTVVITDECAILTRPGAPSRRAEVDTVASALAPHRSITRLRPPATLDGGDVLRVDRVVLVGASSRSNPPGIDQLAAALTPHGYRVLPVPVHGRLHLKSAASYLGRGMLVIDPNAIDADILVAAVGDSLEVMEVAPGEELAANLLAIGNTVLCPLSCPNTARSLEQRDWTVVRVDISELAKAESGLTCSSVIFRS